MVQYDLNKVYVGETKQDEFKKNKTKYLRYGQHQDKYIYIDTSRKK